jgi:hypothetical protein
MGCAMILGNKKYAVSDELRVPSWRLREEAEKRRAAEARIAELEQRIAELERALKSRRDEFVFRRKSRVA